MSTQAPAVSLIGVGIDGYPEGRDAAALGTAIARATGAEVLLVAVHPDPLVVLPAGMNWSGLEEQARGTLIEVRDAISPGARITVETDGSVARALHRVVRRENRDLLVLGSSRHGPKGHVRIGKRVRQLLCHFECALAVAPRGLHELASVPLGRIGVGYDATAEAEVALAFAESLAVAAGAELHLRGVVDDRLPPIGFSSLAGGGSHAPVWEDGIAEEMHRLEAKLDEAASGHPGGETRTDVMRGRPGNALLDLSREVDLLVIGSRHWGPAERVLLGSTGETVLHDAACPVIAVPRPAA
jgi:nucleotide-binding universal stress UspA family protein